MKTGAVHGKIMGKRLEHRPIFEEKRSWNHGNPGKILRTDWRSWENRREKPSRIVCLGNSSKWEIWQLTMSDYQRVNGQWWFVSLMSPLFGWFIWFIFLFLFVKISPCFGDEHHKYPTPSGYSMPFI